MKTATRFILTPLIAIAGTLMAQTVSPDAEKASAIRALTEAREFIWTYETTVRPLEKAVALAWWEANVTGKDEAFQAKETAQNKLDEALSDRSRFEKLKSLREAKIENPILARQIEVLYLSHLEKQVDPELLKRITAKANAIEQAFNVFRATIDGRQITDSEVRKVLKQSKDSAERKAVWDASKKVGTVIESDLKELVGLRNQAARKLGFKDYHVLQLFLSEQNQEEVLRLFDQLDQLTREPFREAKAEIDARLAQHYSIRMGDLRPWHYHDPFFQESPAVFETSLDDVYAKTDILKLCRDYYAGMGLPIDDVIARSDLYEKPGKSPHAFCIDIDRQGDVRVLGNIVPNHYWMGTMLHELGHAVYSSKNIPQNVPYVLRGEAHTLTTEGVAMMFERAANSADWLTRMGVNVPNPEAFNEAGAKMLRNRLLIFSRWCQVMFRFEKEMYRNPEEDLNKLWWDLVREYQMVTPPEGRHAPDYASKIHVVSAPAYYHNYMMGELFASQVHHTIAREVLRTSPSEALYVGKPEVGDYMKKRVFAPGRTMPWNALTEHATGEKLNAEAFSKDFSRKEAPFSRVN
jgi:peptidyl-dipeptidase A